MLSVFKTDKKYKPDSKYYELCICRASIEDRIANSSLSDKNKNILKLWLKGVEDQLEMYDAAA